VVKIAIENLKSKMLYLLPKFLIYKLIIMNKQHFIFSADSMNSAALKIYSLSASILSMEMIDANKLAQEDTAKRQAEENAKAKKEGNDPESVTPSKAEDFLDSEVGDIVKESENIHSMIHKSCKAFYASNKKVPGKAKKEGYTLPKFEDVAPVFASRNHYTGTKEELKSLIKSQVVVLTSELNKHAGPKVYHENGSVWKKTSTDSKRFLKIEESLKVISESVS